MSTSGGPQLVLIRLELYAQLVVRMTPNVGPAAPEAR